MWRVTDLVTQIIRAALRPVRVRELPRFIDVFLQHVGRRNEKKRPKQIELFQAQLRPLPGSIGPPTRAPPLAA